MQQNNIQTPRDAFSYVMTETVPIQSFAETNVVLGLTPKYMLTVRKRLWCNEGAILILTFAHQLGYKTRLIDLLDKDGISRHTIAEVYEGNKWVQYDYTYNKVGASYLESAGNYTPTPRIAPYPNFYNLLIQNNFFLKKAALQLRSVPETDIPNFKS